MRADILLCAELMQLIIHLELDNFELFSYMHRSMVKRLKKNSKYYPIERLLIHLTGQLFESKDRKEQQSAIKHAKKRLQIIKHNWYEHEILEMLSIELWIKSKQSRVLSH